MYLKGKKEEEDMIINVLLGFEMNVLKELYVVV